MVALFPSASPGDARVNHLAHVWLAGDDPAMTVGAIVADYSRGAPDPRWSRGVRDGVRLHRRIDAWTDTHALQAQARALFEAPFRRYAGIVLDVWFDHLLAVDFENLTGESLRAFCDRAYATLLAGDAPELPAAHRVFITRLARYDGLYAYRERDHLDAVYTRIGERLARSNPLASALPVVEALERPLARMFAQFWPALAAFAAETRVALATQPEAI
jgi:acyl carrier protein phosphodiesterase